MTGFEGSKFEIKVTGRKSPNAESTGVTLVGEIVSCVDVDGREMDFFEIFCDVVRYARRHSKPEIEYPEAMQIRIHPGHWVKVNLSRN